MDTLYSRRSHRKYLPWKEDGQFLEDLSSLLDAACAARGARQGSVFAVTQKAALDAVKVAANKGLAGKINMWIPRMPLAGVLVLDLPAADVRAERPSEFLKTVLAAHDAMLWLTERGFGTCWLAGISEREVRKELGLAADRSVPAIISFGLPALKVPSAATVGGVTYRMMSRRRKPLSKIACLESADRAWRTGTIEAEGFAASTLDVAGLLSSMTEDRRPDAARAPLDLCVEACLEAARVAPSGNNAQDWLFVAVREEDRLSRLAALCGAEPRGGWESAVVAAGRDRKFESMLMDKPFWALDVPIAMSQLSLAAVSMGYGAEVITDLADEAAIRDFVELPRGMRVVGVVGLA